MTGDFNYLTAIQLEVIFATSQRIMLKAVYSVVRLIDDTGMHCSPWEY